MQEVVRELLDRRCKKACRTILSAKEEMSDPHCPTHDNHRFRRVILDQVNDFHKLCVDVLESLDTGVVVNELYLKKIDDIHSYIQDLEYEDDYDEG